MCHVTHKVSTSSVANRRPLCRSVEHGSYPELPLLASATDHPSVIVETPKTCKKYNLTNLVIMLICANALPNHTFNALQIPPLPFPISENKIPQTERLRCPLYRECSLLTPELVSARSFPTYPGNIRL
jgi:hypothetical protein